MSNKINVRSPFIIKTNSDPSLSYVDLNLYIYNGAYTATPSPVTYSFSKSVIGSNQFVVFEIADYVRDYIETEFGEYATNAVWVRWEYQLRDVNGGPLGALVAEDALAVDGYGYFEEGINPDVRSGLMQDNTDIYYEDGQDIILPVFSEVVSQVEFPAGSVPTVLWDQYTEYWENASVVWETGGTAQAIADSTDSNFKIMYIRITDTENLPDVQQVNILHRAGEGADEVVYLRKVCEVKYDPMKVIFYNKYGAMQDLWFFKRSDISLNVTSDTFKRNTLDTSNAPTYNTAKHQIKTFNLNGKESIKLNTDYLPEDFNGIIEQLLLSEEVWIDNGTNVLPVRPATSSLTFKKGVNDKLISYTLDFEYAFDKINNIR